MRERESVGALYILGKRQHATNNLVCFAKFEYDYNKSIGVIYSFNLRNETQYKKEFTNLIKNFFYVNDECESKLHAK